MIPKRFHFHTFSFFMSFFMSGVMSFAMLALKSDTLIEVMSNWSGAWSISMLVAFPVSILVVPISHKLAHKIVAAK